MGLSNPAVATGSSKKTRRSKKRRTAEVSDSDSSSSSSSSSESESEENGNANEIALEEDVDDAAQLQELDVELSDAESSKFDGAALNQDENMDKATREALNDIPLTTTELSRSSYKNVNNIDLTKIQQTLQEAEKRVSSAKDQGQLKNAYLGVLFNHYGEDVNSLREAQDFTPKSLVLLANVLKDGGQIFDIDTLRAVVESEQ
ncbi:LAFA_0F17876g1_1 [Lachancea sp. 'fantastica']|nr:LAFA_0F17876g1_1 [Lachancea sp. 'fantastica']